MSTRSRSLQVNGPNNNNTTVLTQVNLQDGSYFTFNYKTAFAQVNRINRYAAYQHILSYTSFNVNSAAGQTESPRFTQRKEWAENWNNHNEVVTNFSAAADNSWAMQTTIYAPRGRERIASAGLVSTRPAIILAPSLTPTERLTS